MTNAVTSEADPSRPDRRRAGARPAGHAVNGPGTPADAAAAAIVSQPGVAAAPALDEGVSTYALLTDGSTVEIRPAGPQDGAAVREMHAAMSPDNMYLRFFSLSPRSAEQEAIRVCREPDADHGALLAWLGRRLVGVASYEPAGTPGTAEIAFAVPDDMHRRGVATLLLEHLVSLARLRGMTAFTAQTLADNAAMLRVFADAGLPRQRRMVDGVVELTFPLPGGDADERLVSYLQSVASRESRADVASLRHLLQPESVAVVGAGRRRRTVGRAILHNIVAGGFAGRIYAVNLHARHMEGVPCLPSVGALPEAVDLAIIAVPAAAVPAVAAACGDKGVKALTVITSGLGAAGADLLAICRRHGMRLVGPNCLGVSVPALGLNATFAARQPVRGVAGLVVQSAGVGIALLDQLSRLGIGVSSFASVGDKYDVSSNDMLMWWEQDSLTRLALLYVESFGSPRKFARTARRVSQRMPVLTVVGGRSPAGRSAAASHTAAAATPLVTQEALFGQAGIIAASSLGELVEAAALLACQPLPAGNRVAIITNAGGAGVLAADACGDYGLEVAALSGPTRRRLRGLLPAAAAVAGPVDTTAGVSADTFRACLEQVCADDGVDAVIAVTVPTALSDLRPAITGAAVSKPIAAALLEQPESVRLLRRDQAEPQAQPPAEPANGEPDTAGAATGGAASEGAAGPAVAGLPAYAYPESAARALGHAAAYRAWRDRQSEPVPQLSGLQTPAARELVAGFLASQPGGGWLPAPLAAELAACYQLPIATSVPAGDEHQAIDAAARPGGVEVVIGIRQEPVFGPLVVFGLGGVATDIPGDCAARLTPLTRADADELIRELHGAPLLSGHRGSRPVDTAALADVLLRVSRLADDLPEVAELDLSPIVASPDGACAVDVRVRVAPAEAQDPFLRRLR
jgi:acyl-CoA synthetase (NDP forming)/GNAT superfamily N-acetyltransferase